MAAGLLAAFWLSQTQAPGSPGASPGVEEPGEALDTVEVAQTAADESIADDVAPGVEEASSGAEDASDVELAIAFELDNLRDLEEIRDLDLLEALLAFEERQAEEQGRS